MKATTRILFWEGLVLLVFAGLTPLFFSFRAAYELLFPVACGGLGLLALTIALFTFAAQWSKTRAENAGRGMQETTKFGANAVLYTVIFVAVLVFANVLAHGHEKKIDLTRAKVNTLSDQTVTALKNIPAGAPLEIVGFFKAGEAKDFEQLAAKYKAVNPKQVEVRAIDPDLHPEEVSKYAISQRGAVAVTCGVAPEPNAPRPKDNRCTGQTNVTMDVNEQGLTTAVVKVSAPQAGAVYFVEGHGEVPLDGNEERGYALLKKGLANENIELKTTMLLREGRIPADARLLIVAGPTKKFPPEEIAMLEKHLETGGRLMVLLDPMTDTGLEPLLAKYGVVPQDDIVVDRQMRLFEGSVAGLDPIVVDYGEHEITKKFGRNPTLFHEARSLKIDAKGALPGANAEPLLRTGPQSWATSDFSFMKSGSEPKMDAKKDAAGPLVLGVAVERTVGEGDNRKQARLVAIGDADFAANRYVAQGYNADLFFNSINWLTGQEAYISIRPNTFAPDVFTVTEKDTALIFFASVFLLPQLVIMLGIGVAIRRRT